MKIGQCANGVKITLEFLTSMHKLPTVPGTMSPVPCAARSKVIVSTCRDTVSKRCTKKYSNGETERIRRHSSTTPQADHTTAPSWSRYFRVNVYLWRVRSRSCYPVAVVEHVRSRKCFTWVGCTYCTYPAKTSHKGRLVCP